MATVSDNYLATKPAGDIGPRDTCPFCKRIAAGEYDYSDARCVAFQPLDPVTPGHFLVVPRSHISNVFANPVQAGHAMKFAGFLANQMDLGAANFITSAGSAATQTVFHLHVHVVPRREGDGLHLPWTNQPAAAAAADALIDGGPFTPMYKGDPRGGAS